MKKRIFTIFIFLLVSCSTEEVDSESSVNPVAKDDFISITEDTPTDFNTLLSNDKSNAAIVSSFDSTSEKGGEIVSNGDETYTYFPPKAFVGIDVFTYTICNIQNPSNCSTASVTVTVLDQGSPIAKNDTVKAILNEVITFQNLLQNDELTDDAQMISIDSSASSGTVTLNEDQSITYTPLANSLAQDSFTYTICDDDTPSPSCDSATVIVSVVDALMFNIPDHLIYYYGSTIFTSNTGENKAALSELTNSKHTTILTYFDRHDFLYDADQDPSNDDNVLLIYSGESRYWREYTSGSNSYPTQTFNTEHVYPQSLLSSGIAKTDLHHLRTCDSGVNSNRSNKKFTSGSGTYKKTGLGWYPGDEWKGDVARMIFYLNIRYNESISDVCSLELLLQWNVEDPVSEIEENRNNVIESAQGNRNPFIDNPYLATLSWGGEAAENKWD